MRSRFSVDLRSARLRANGAYQLVNFDRLSAVEQETLESISRDPECYGVLRPRASGTLTTKSVSRDVALLWLTLQEPASLPSYAVRMLGASCEEFVCKMILDGLLEIEHQGQMVTGPAAEVLICAQTIPLREKATLATLSKRALIYAAVLEASDPLMLTARLYEYNRLPASPRWCNLWQDARAVRRYLGIDSEMGSEWLHTEHWFAWSAPETQLNPNRPVWKLYISPAMSAVQEAFRTATTIVVNSKAVHMKIGSTAEGLLRPDKIVAYFREMSDLSEAAQRILEMLNACPAHGVPFTAEIGGEGLLSWGMDPAADIYAVPWLVQESWRMRICRRLATALLAARSEGLVAEAACDFAMRRIEMDGVDVSVWAPHGNIGRLF